METGGLGRLVPSAGVEPGTKVEVRSKFDRAWSRGFEIAEVVEQSGDPTVPGPAYRLRRRSDGQVLPALFVEDDVREERKGRGMWWY